MLRSAVSKALWVGWLASALFGLALVLGLLFGAASMAFGANGGNFILGQDNTASLLTRLTGNVDGASMQVVNNRPGTGDTALNLQVQQGEAPMIVNATAGKATNLNADKVDNVSLRCPSGTRYHEGVCIQLSLRGTASSFDAAQSDCLDEPRTRLPTPGELQTLEGRTFREWSNHTYQDFGTTTFDIDITVNPDGTLATSTTSGITNAYRCVKLPS